MPRKAPTAPEGKTHKLKDHVPPEGINAGPAESADGATAARAGMSNGFDPEKASGYISAAEAEEMAIEEIMRKAREACQPHVDEIKEIKKAAAEEKIPKKVFAAKLRERADKRKAERRRSVLSEDQRQTFDQLSLALGELVDTPLGASALDRAAKAEASTTTH